MFGEFLRKNIFPNGNPASYVEYGYGQVEPNHLSAQYTGQIYAQLPAAADIDVLQNGQFVKYDYANGVVNFTGAGEWMLVYNEIKLYRDNQMDCEFAMIKDNYEARVYSPFGGAKNGDVDTVNFDGQGTKQSRYYNGVDSEGNTGYTRTPATYVTASSYGTYDATQTYYKLINGVYQVVASPNVDDFPDYFVKTADAVVYKYDDVTAGPDMYEPYYNEDPFHIEGAYKEAMMPEGTKMVPRVFKTNVGDIFTTNTIKVQNATTPELAVGNILVPGVNGILEAAGQNPTGMQWQVVKVYTMPDHQRGAKIMRIA